MAALNPIDDPEAYDLFVVEGVLAPGIVAKGGIVGFKREHTFEFKKGKGKKGAPPTLTQLPEAKGSVKFLLWTAEHFQEWDESFRAKWQYDPTKKKKQAIGVFHPTLAKNGVTAVVCTSIGEETSEGNGLWSITLELSEYFPEDPKNATGTPSGAKVNTPGGGPTGTSNDPIADAQQAEIKKLLEEANKP